MSVKMIQTLNTSSSNVIVAPSVGFEKGRLALGFPNLASDNDNNVILYTGTGTSNTPVAIGGAGHFARKTLNNLGLTGVIIANGTGNATNVSSSTASQYFRRNSNNNGYEFGDLSVNLATTQVTGTLPVGSGGTGSTSTPTTGGIVYGVSSSAYGTSAAGTSGQLLRSNGNGAPTWTSSASVDSNGVVLVDGTANYPSIKFNNKGANGPNASVISAYNGAMYQASDNTLKFVAGTAERTIAFTSQIPNVFTIIAVAGQSNVEADSSTDTLTLASGTGIILTTDAGNDTVTIATNATSANGASNIVARDTNGSFSANVVTASLSGNATSANNVAGGAVNQLIFQTGSGATSFVPAPTAASQVLVSHPAGNLTTAVWVSTTGSDNIVRASSPTITSPSVATSITTGSTSFNLINDTATTVNFAGAATALNLGATTGSTTVRNNLTVTGNLIVNGTTTTVNTTTITIDDPVFTIGGDTAPASDDNKDRGIEFRWHNGTTAKVGFFGYDDSSQKFTFIPDATNSSEVFSGTKGIIDANIEWADILNKPAFTSGTVTSVGGTGTVNGINLSGTVTTSGNLTLGGTLSISNLDWSGADLAIANGGTGASTESQARTNLGLAIGTNVQAYDAGLNSIAGLTTAADQMIYTTASDTYTTTSLTSFGRSLIDDADAATARTTLGLGTISTQNSNNVTITGGSITGATVDGGTY